MKAATPTKHVRATVQGKVGTKHVKMRELSGPEEIAAIVEVGNAVGTIGQYLRGLHELHRAIISVDGVKIDQSSTTAEGIRELFSAKEFMLVCEMYASLSRPTEDEVAAFRAGLEYGAVDHDSTAGTSD